jgi:hypothetical protein
MALKQLVIDVKMLVGPKYQDRFGNREEKDNS